MVRTFIKNGVNVNFKDSEGKTALMVAAFFNSEPEVIRVLIEAGADVGIKDEKGYFAINYARENHDIYGTDAFRLLEKLTLEQ